MARLVVLYFVNFPSGSFLYSIFTRSYLQETALYYKCTVCHILRFLYELWEPGVDLNIIQKISKFHQQHKQQRERNCWWKIKTARHTLQSLFLARDWGAKHI